MMDLPTPALESRLTTLPAEIRFQIYTYLFDSWTLCINCTRAASETSKADEKRGDAPHHRDSSLSVRATDFPSGSFGVCRSIYYDLKALQPFPVGVIQVDCDLASASWLRAIFREVFEDLSDRVDCLRARKLVVNQDGVYGLDIGLVKGRMANGLEIIEVGMRDLAVNAQYAAAWVQIALEKEGEIVKCEPEAQGYVSTEFAFGYLHSFLGWELPGTGAPRGVHIKLLARQEVTIWAEKRCMARLTVVHDIEKRRVLEVQKHSVDDNWCQYFGRPKVLPHSHPVPFFGPWSCLDIPASPESLKPRAVN